MSVILVLGSGPDVVTARDWPRDPFHRIVAINNAWAVRPDWDVLVHPEDFPLERRPIDIHPSKQIVTAEDYVPLQNTLGGFVYAGGTMAFTAAYWALAALQPRVIALMGCDMVYPAGENTHFYGKGAADPLRADISLRSLEAKSARLMALAARRDCAVVNLSTNESRLMLPRCPLDQVHTAPVPELDQTTVIAALAEEQRLGYYVPSGRYWKEADRFDPAAIDRLDALWLNVVKS